MTQETRSTAQQRKIAENAGKVHPWPDEAGEMNLIAWDIYVKNQDFRAHQDWIGGDLIELARVSRLQAIVAEELDKYEAEGTIIMGGKYGKQPVENPRGRAISTLNSTINTMLRRLGITVMSTGTKETRANRAAAERRAEGQLHPPMPQDAGKPVGNPGVAKSDDFLN